MKELLSKLYRGEDGVTVIEYGVIAVLIGIAAVVAMQALGFQVSAMFESVIAGF